MARRAALLAALALPPCAAALPASAALAASPWSAPQDAGPGGRATYANGVPAISSSPRDGFAVLLARTDPRTRQSVVTLRRSGSDGRLGRPLLLARPRVAGDLALDLRPGGDAVAVWRGYVPGVTARGGNYRVFAARTARGAASADVRVDALTGGGESAYRPTFVPGVGGPLVAWSRRTGPIQTARWSGDGPPKLGRLGVALDGVQLAFGAGGAREGDVVVALPGLTRLQLTRSRDGGRTFAPPVTVPDSGLSRTRAVPAVGMDSSGNAVVAWVQRRAGRAEIAASLVPRDAAAPTPATVLDTPGSGTSAPSVAMNEGPVAGALVAWVQTDAVSTVARRPGILRLQRIAADGTTAGGMLRLGGRGEKGSELVLAKRGGRGATAVWRTPSGALRAQDISPEGRPGRAVTLDRGVQPSSMRVAGRGGLVVSWVSRGRVRLAVRP